MAHKKLQTKIGNIYLQTTAQGLSGILWKKPAQDPDNSKKAQIYLEQAEKQVLEYLNGDRKNFKLKLDIQGTEFQKKVWKALTSIPYGKTISYKELAVKVGNENASRAVGTANGKNPISLIIPCHRVIASNGSLGGYAGGLRTKERLLAIEGLILE